MDKEATMFAKWGIWVIVLVGLLPARALAQGPALRFEAPAFQLGEIRCGVPLVHPFTFVNQGDQVVELVEARPGCGCLKPRLEKNTFQPSESGTIPVAINTLGQSAGKHVWHLTLLYREGAGDTIRQVNLSVTGVVVTEVTVQPAELTVYADGPVRHELLLTDLRKVPLTVVSVESSSSKVYARAGPLVKSDLGYFVCKIAVEIAGDLPPGRHDETLVIHTSDPLYRELHIPVAVIKRDK
jgi:hypothetical protein